jgi:hypothetical protein
VTEGARERIKRLRDEETERLRDDLSDLRDLRDLRERSEGMVPISFFSDRNLRQDLVKKLLN